jgi:hypothetical protein
VIRVSAFVCAVVLILPCRLAAIDDSYDCASTAHTNVGWSSRAAAYTAETTTKLGKVSTVESTGMKSERPFLTGQSVTALQRLSSDGRAIWFAERAQEGTIILWTFFPKQKDGEVPTDVLVSSKSYDLFGPVNFTDVYACKPNAALARE